MTGRDATIFALASGGGRAAIAVVRLSGPATGDIVKAVAGRLPPPRVATLATFRDPRDGEAIDRGLLVYFEGPASFTGEDGAEFHVHGGRAVVAGLVDAIARDPRARAAEPGEFARRALLSGKLDLAQVEGIGDLVEAETAGQRRQALRQAQGALGRRVAQWRESLLEASARVAAEIDFSDEADVATTSADDIRRLLAPLLADLEAELVAGRAGERIREGLTIVIVGPPNAGKSTLMNALVRREVAIVTQKAGTTRDAIEIAVDLDGYAATLIDTAGLREASEEAERIGVARSLERAARADLVLWLSDARDWLAPDPRLSGPPLWPIASKGDLPGVSSLPGAILQISARSGLNMGELLDRLRAFAFEASGSGFEGVIVRQRHRRAIEDAAAALEPIVFGRELPVEILAEQLRTAAFALERLIGRVDVEDVLGDIFSRFCIGK